MQQAFICDAVRTPFGRYGGALSALRADDLAALPLKALLARLPQLIPTPLMTLFWGAPTRPVKTTATWREWRCCWPDYPHRAGHHPQSPVRFGIGRGRHGGARH